MAADQRERYARQVDGEDDVSDARYGGDGAGTGKRGDVRDVRYVEDGAGDARADDARAQGEKCRSREEGDVDTRYRRHWRCMIPTATVRTATVPTVPIPTATMLTVPTVPVPVPVTVTAI